MDQCHNGYGLFEENIDSKVEDVILKPTIEQSTKKLTAMNILTKIFGTFSTGSNALSTTKES